MFTRTSTVARGLCVFVALFSSSVAFANRGGIAVPPAGGCNACHGGGTAPVVTITGVPAGANALDLAVTITTPNGDSAGFNLRANNGTLSNPGPGAKIMAGSATHNLAKVADASDNVTFTVHWSHTNPTGPVTFTAWGNSVNGDLNTSGDAASSTTLTCGLWYVDADNDGRGAGAPIIACTQPNDAVAQAGDCDDSNGSIRPGAAEICNQIDDDCDGSVDESAGPTWYADADGDTYGNPTSSVIACQQPVGYVANASDCDDSDNTINPEGTEACNGADDDCDAEIDEGFNGGETWYRDQDGDGFGGAVAVQTCAQPAGHVAITGDCDDTAASVKPGADEVCNGVDDDCDGMSDEGLALQTWFLDQDGDGVGGSTTVQACAAPANHVASTGDCNDSEASVKPGAAEVCNGRDDDCNSVVDDGVETCNGVDDDCDGEVDEAPEMLCSLGETCSQGACGEPGTDAGTDAGTTLPKGEFVDAGTGPGGAINPPQRETGCGCTGASGAAFMWAGALLVAAMLRRSRSSQSGS